MKFHLLTILALISMGTAQNISAQNPSKSPFVWEGANLYFLLTDRFENANTNNDINFARTLPTGKLRGFEGGDLQGITKKINEGYFDKLGINVIWMTPIVEQIHGGVDEGSGFTYGFHGYWAKDWTALDPNFGTEADLIAMVEAAHARGIRIMLDGVINHTGPVTALDPVWPAEWVRTGPQCAYNSYDSTTACTLVANLPDVITEKQMEVDLPPALVKKWNAEGRYKKEMKELKDFFKKTGYPRAPKYYIIKWLTDYIRKYGIDGYRADTVKHLDEKTWSEFKTQCNIAFSQYKAANPTKVLDDNDFYLLGEVYGYSVANGKDYDFGDRKVDYFNYGFNNLINFQFRWDAEKTYEELFSTYSEKLNGALDGYSITNYISSHDDSNPFDPMRLKNKEAATKLLLCPGISQVYYGDETSRVLKVDGAQGDANLRSNMNWDELKNDAQKAEILLHYQKLGQFRKNHPAIGAGVHRRISQTPYLFSRGYENGEIKDRVIVGLDLPQGLKKIKVSAVFSNGTVLKDAYSGKSATVKFGEIELDTPFDIVLLEQK